MTTTLAGALDLARFLAPCRFHRTFFRHLDRLAGGDGWTCEPSRRTVSEAGYAHG